MSNPAQAGLSLQTKQDKTWFFLLCGQLPKINELIFLVFYLVIFSHPAKG